MLINFFPPQFITKDRTSGAHFRSKWHSFESRFVSRHGDGCLWITDRSISRMPYFYSNCRMKRDLPDDLDTFVFFSRSWQFPLVSLVRHARRILFLLMAGHLLVVLAVIFTPLGFPYSTGIVEDKPQRVQILVD